MEKTPARNPENLDGEVLPLSLPGADPRFRLCDCGGADGSYCSEWCPRVAH